MARGSLANSPSNLNLSRRETALFQQIILVGNRMSRVLKLDPSLSIPKERHLLERKWSALMVELAKMLI